MLLTGEMIETEGSEHWGLVNRMVPGAICRGVVVVFANKRAKKGPVAINYHS